MAPTPAKVSTAAPRRWRGAAAGVGFALLFGTPAVWHVSRPSAWAGEVPRSTHAFFPRPSVPEFFPRPSAADFLVADGVEPQLPVGIAISALDVVAPVVSVGLAADGSMQVPEDVTTVGWYELGVVPGAAGTAVFAGHVDSREQGRGTFFDLRRLDVGDLITVTHEQGSVTSWQVVARRSYPKDELPIGDIFTRFSEPRLVLITCGGDFDDQTRYYTENVVVYAEPVGQGTDARS